MVVLYFVYVSRVILSFGVFPFFVRYFVDRSYANSKMLLRFISAIR
ncbi:hypothetical protein HanOQP8_Chr14g0510931 [Helianthus annuus]|nr:hypothetical protein HanOQP8_Chr14g0510931 [Helianthus annuus]